MAQRVKIAKGKEFTFKKAAGGGETKYPWTEWFSTELGSTGVGDLDKREKAEYDALSPDEQRAYREKRHLVLLERDVLSPTEKNAEGEPVVIEKRDYNVDTNAMPAKIKTAARRQYKVVQIARIGPDGNKLHDSLIIRARDMTPEERLAEDQLRAEEKDEAKAKKKAAAAANGAPAATEVAPATQS